MNVSLLAASSLLQQHASGPSAADPAELAARQEAAKQEVAQQFEGVLISMLLKQMRETLDEGMFGGENSDTLGAMFDMYLGEHAAQGSNLGIRNLVLNQLNQQQGTRL